MPAAELMQLAADAFIASLQVVEPLHPDLQRCYGAASFGSYSLPCVRHPLVYSVPHVEHLNANVNARYEAKKAEAADALARNDPARYVLMHERPYRSEALLKLLRLGVFDRIKDGAATYWQQVASWWIDSENVVQTMPIWRVLWRGPSAYRIHRSAAMLDEEKAELALMPGLITVYHGEEARGKVGWSWTTSLKTAKWFANRFDAGGKVYQGIAPKEKVIAYLSRRGESEVLIQPNDVQEKRVITKE